MTLKFSKKVYQYHFKIEDIIVHTDITTDIQREEYKLQNLGVYTLHEGKKLYWKKGKIEQVGTFTSYEEAIVWKYKNATPLNYEGVYLGEEN